MKGNSSLLPEAHLLIQLVHVSYVLCSASKSIALVKCIFGVTKINGTADGRLHMRVAVMETLLMCTVHSIHARDYGHKTQRAL